LKSHTVYEKTTQKSQKPLDVATEWFIVQLVLRFLHWSSAGNENDRFPNYWGELTDAVERIPEGSV